MKSSLLKNFLCTSILLVFAFVVFTVGMEYRKIRPSMNNGNIEADLDFFNSRPVPSNAFRILFIGDSLTLHGKVPQLWDYFGGMASSSIYNDFVHLFVNHIQPINSKPIEIFYDNGGDGHLSSMLEYLKKHQEIKPDLIIFQGGENDKFNQKFRTEYMEIIRSSRSIIVLGDWWSDKKSDFEHELSSSESLPFIDLRKIQRDPQNSGYDGPYHSIGVAGHPNDRGMYEIAMAINQVYDIHRRDYR
jgi:hypothetical protein